MTQDEIREALVDGCLRRESLAVEFRGGNGERCAALGRVIAVRERFAVIVMGSRDSLVQLSSVLHVARLDAPGSAS